MRPLKGIEDAVARMALPGCVASTRQPLDDGLAVKTERASDLDDGQALPVSAVVDHGERLVVDHDRTYARSGRCCGRALRHGENVLPQS